MRAAFATPSADRKGISVPAVNVVLITIPEPRASIEGSTAWINEMGSRTEVSMDGHQSCIIDGSEAKGRR